MGGESLDPYYSCHMACTNHEMAEKNEQPYVTFAKKNVGRIDGRVLLLDLIRDLFLPWR